MRLTMIAWIVVASALSVACGDDQGDEAAEPTSSSASADVTAEFCDAYDDYLAAQDGAQLNTALGTMSKELPDDAPAEVADALETLGTGDIPPEETVAAGAALEAWAVPACEGV